MRVGVQLFPGQASDAVAEARRCEELGFSSVWIADHYTGGGRNRGWIVPEMFATLGAIAQATERIGIGSCVASVSKRDAPSLAHAALTLSELSGGRFLLGLGSGFGPDSKLFGIGVDRPASRCQEAIEVIRGLWDSSPERPFDYEGRWHHLEGAFLNLPGAEPPPLALAAQGARMLEITGRLTDGWLPFALSPETYGEFLGRIPDRSESFRPMLWLPTFVESGGADRSAEAEQTGRMYLSMAPAILEAALGTDPSAKGTSDWDPSDAEALAERISPELAMSVTLTGGPAACAETLKRFEAAGCEEVVLRITSSAARPSDVETLASEVLPMA